MNTKFEIKNIVCRISLVVVLTSFLSTFYGQQMPQTNLYTNNIYNINPAYAGYNPNCLEAYIGHMTQWVGVEGAPSTNYLDIHKGFGKNFGLGGGFILDKTNMVNRFSGNLSGSYRIGLNENSNLRFGLSLGMYQVSINTSDAVVQDPTDELVSNSSSGITLNNELGLIYNYKKFILGVAVPQVFETKAKYDVQTTTASFEVNRHFTAFTKYGWDVSEKFELEPSVLMKRVTNVNQFDFNFMGTYNNLISLGFGYRTDVGLLARLRLKLQEMFVLAYAYEFAGSNISSYSSGSHEVMLGIKFCKEKPIDQPRIESAIPPPIMDEPKPIIEEDLVTEPEPINEPELKSEPKPATPIKLSKEERKLFQNQFTFELGDVSMSPSSVAKLNEMVKVMKKYPNLKIEIIGHSCDKGTDLRKEIVSTTRADNVKRYMAGKGIDASRITASGASNTSPLVPNTDDDNRSKNRRVEFKLIE